MKPIAADGRNQNENVECRMLNIECRMKRFKSFSQSRARSKRTITDADRKTLMEAIIFVFRW